MPQQVLEPQEATYPKLAPLPRRYATPGRRQPRDNSSSRASVTLLFLTILAYSLIVGYLAVFRHQRFGSYAYDLGIYDQALWLISKGYTPYSTVRGLHLLGDHFTPILYPLALLYRLPFSTNLLLILQTVLLASGAWPLYRMSVRLSATPWVGLVAGISYLLYPALRGVNFFDFHPIAFAIPGLLYALDFASERKALPFFLACFWTLLCKQEAALVVAGLGFWYAARWRQPKAIGLTLGALLWFLCALRLQAYYAGTTESSYAELYSHLGRNSAQIAQTFLQRPWVALASLDTGSVSNYLLLLLAPLALLPLRTPGILWLLLFPLILNLFSNRTAMREINFQYTALLTPILFAAAAVSLARLAPGPLRRSAGAAWLISATVAAFTCIPTQQRPFDPPVTAEAAAAITTLLQRIPPTASVCATQALVPHLSQRREIHVFPNPFWILATGPSRDALRHQLGQGHPPVDSRQLQRALSSSNVEYLVIGHRLQARQGGFPMNGPEAPLLIAEALLNPSYGIVASEAGIWILRKGADHQAGLQHLRPGSALTHGELLELAQELCTP